ncbi:hypothetical protein CYMTET_31374 [Cymbomonas tetramitiformis]|uniref:Uncharacterized protein n=1 Tax=Cymbomonas tetramitiformis TaxID=36881 RepID=A0AAE0KSZ0_9CHLO|nr:hypothetical protein CYMTET_31374 [Cymbomonas tetramitiformis]
MTRQAADIQEEIKIADSKGKLQAPADAEELCEGDPASPSFTAQDVLQALAQQPQQQQQQHLAQQNEIMAALGKTPVSAQTAEQQIDETHRTVMGAHTLLANRYSMVQLCTSLNGAASARGGQKHREALTRQHGSTESEAGSHGGKGLSVIKAELELAQLLLLLLPRPRGVRALPYMVKILMPASRKEEAYELRHRGERALNCSGLGGMKKGEITWEPLGVMGAQWEPAVYLAVPAARLYALYFVLANKRSWGAKVKITRQAWVVEATVHVEQEEDPVSDPSQAAHQRLADGPGVEFSTSIDRFASEVSAQPPRYCAQWWDPYCEGLDALAYDWRGEANRINSPWGLVDEVADAAGGGCWGHGGGVVLAGPGLVPGVRGDRGREGETQVLHDDGDVEWLLLEEERTRVIAAQQAVEEEALRALTRGDYAPKAKRLREFRGDEGREWLPASDETACLCVASLLPTGEAQRQQRARRKRSEPGCQRGTCTACDTGVDPADWCLVATGGCLPGERVSSSGSDTDLANQWLELALGR